MCSSQPPWRTPTYSFILSLPRVLFLSWLVQLRLSIELALPMTLILNSTFLSRSRRWSRVLS